LACPKEGLEKLLTDAVLAFEVDPAYIGSLGFCGGMGDGAPLDKAVTCDELEESLSESSASWGLA